MRFTYTKSLTEAGGEVLVISTRRDTKKYAMLLVNSQVALLVHDFSSASAADDANYSTRQGKARYTITLNGTVQEAHGDVAERYRAVHLQNNASYRQFIEGSDIAIILVTLTSARVCDVNDSVRVYSKEGLAWHEAPASGSTPRRRCARINSVLGCYYTDLPRSRRIAARRLRSTAAHTAGSAEGSVTPEIDVAAVVDGKRECVPVEVGGDAHERARRRAAAQRSGDGLAFARASVKPPFVLVYTWPVSGYRPQHLPLPSSAASATPISMPSPDASKDAAILIVHECRPLARIGSPNAAAAPPCFTQTAVLPSEISNAPRRRWTRWFATWLAF